MSVTVRVPTILRRHTGGAKQVDVDGGTLREVLTALEARYPGSTSPVLDDAGNPRSFVNLYVADTDVRFGAGLDTPTPNGSQVSIIPAMAGG